ncbi:MAG: site-specific DNA-methyltransferase [Bacteroidales bacterium]|nr:site-specific DNA-methyltransferase [Bacteroidales bacterium]
MKIESANLSQLQVNGSNPRIIKDEKFEKLITSILVLPKMLSIRPIVVDDTMTALGGNMRLRALSAISDMPEEEIRQRLAESRDFQKKTDPERNNLIDYWLAWQDKPTTPIIKASELSDAEKREFIIKDNVGYGEWDYDALANEWDSQDLDDWGVDVWQNNGWEEGSSGDGGVKDGGPANASLNDRFIVPPFSILDTRKGYWQKRKKLWREIIGNTGETRTDKLIKSPEIKYKDLYQKTRKHREELGLSFAEYLEKYVPEDVKEQEAQKVLSAGVSLFDPVLSEIMCRWFTPHEKSLIFDPFAGDTQKGFVFGTLGHVFTGIELRKEQVETNEKVIDGKNIEVKYICDDGCNVAKYFKPESQDFLFSCPPYYNLEVYSDLDNDASNQDTYEDFIAILRKAYSEAIKCLAENRFAVIVVGDIRNRKNDFYYDFAGDIKRIFADNGMYLYNEVILIETGASTALRAGRYMESRKVAKMHQNVLIFYKGDARTIKTEFPKIEYTAEDDAMFKSESLGETTEKQNDNADIE